jgi:hypothetical protein
MKFVYELGDGIMSNITSCGRELRNTYAGSGPDPDVDDDVTRILFVHHLTGHLCTISRKYFD